ncbi:peptidoglycan-binding domain-containing protein [Aliinostoc sp. HNIBRCY26]|uniref:peptidoglycan-binding domain-containing protein n=1 Tax=Aliinostoc sp. HNIBRCY26 TaxID=3418997 RepID=UPI003D032AC1
MSDIAMLMTSVLMTKQPSAAPVINPPIIQSEQNMQEVIPNPPFQLTAQAQAIAPRYVSPSSHVPRNSLAHKPKPQKSRLTRVKQRLPKNLNQITKSSAVKSLKDNVPARTSLIVQQRRDKLIPNKLPKASLLNRRKLTNQQNRGDDLAFVSSPSFSRYPLPNLRFRHSGVAVKVLQRLLMANGYYVGVDGNFGALTESAVKAFQAKHNLKVDGIVGSKTWQYLSMYSQ